MEKRVLIIGTGGTIASAPSSNGNAPSHSISDILNVLHVNNPFEMPSNEKVIIETQALMTKDSTNMLPMDWVQIAKAVNDAYELRRYNGIVVTHGTDTMAYTSSMLAFMLKGMPIPVVLTGSMHLPTDGGTDASKNIRDAITVAANGKFGFVTVVFGGQVILGCRASKVELERDMAFKSINTPPLAKINGDNKLSINPDASFPNPSASKQVDFDFDPRIKIVTMFPGITPKEFNVSERRYKDLIIETYGRGGLPNNDGYDFMSVIRRVANKMPVVVGSQSTFGSTSLEEYAVGHNALDCGVIESADMSQEATVTKLMWALGKRADLSDVKKMMRTNYCGEIKLRA